MKLVDSWRVELWLLWLNVWVGVTVIALQKINSLAHSAIAVLLQPVVTGEVGPTLKTTHVRQPSSLESCRIYTASTARALSAENY